MKKIILYLLLVLLLPSLKAQNNVSQLRQQLENKTNLTDVMETVDAFYKNRNTPKDEREWKHWKRWQWHMSRYINADGNLVNTRAIHYEGTRQSRLQNNGLNSLNTPSSGTWSSIGPNSFNLLADVYSGLGRVNRITFHPDNANILFAGTPNGGIWKSTDGGSNWSALDNYGPELGVSGMVVSYADPNDLYVLTGDGDGGGFITNLGYRSYSIGVMKSTDGGINWTLQTNGLPASGFRGYSMVQCPADPNVLIVATDDGIYRTRNGGNSWVLEYNNFVSDVEFMPGSANVCYAAGDGWFRKSTDTGNTWSTVNFIESPSGANRMQIGVSPAANNYVYLLCGPVISTGVFKGVWRSTNSGDNFTKLATTPNILGNVTNGQDDTDQSGYDLAMAVSSTDPQDVFAAGTTVWKSTNGGNSFSYATLYVENALLMSRYIHPDVHDLQVNPLNGYLWAATDGGVYRSTDNGTNWTDLSADISTAQPYHLAGVENNSAILYIGTQDNGLKNRYAFTSTWEHYYGRDGFDVAINYDDNSRSYGSVNKSLLRFTNDGANRNGISPDTGSWFPTIAIHPTDPATIYCGYGDDVFRSTNSGDDWSNRGASGSWCIATCPSNSQRVYSAGGTTYNSATGILYRSDFSADSWSILSNNTGFPNPFPKITSIGVNPTNSLRVWVTFGGTTANTKVYYTNDGGDTWTNISSTALPNVPINCIAITSTNDAYIGTDIGVYYRPSGGNWMPFSNGLPQSPVSDIELNETVGLVRVSLFGRGVWSSSIFSNCPISQLVSGTETGFKLYEASDNVYSSGTTTIAGGNGTEIYFKGGSEVNLVDGFEVKPGSSFRAYIDNCGDGGIPAMNASTGQVIPITKVRMPSNKSRLHPFGTITLNADGSNVTRNITEPGNYAMRIVNESGTLIKEYPSEYLSQGKHIYSLRYTEPAKDMLYLQLVLNNEVVHYQELNNLNLKK